MRKLSRELMIVVSVLSIMLLCFQVYTAIVGVFDDVIQRSVHLAFVLALCFLLKPVYKGQDTTKVPLYDYVLVVLSVASCVYITMIWSQVGWDPLMWVSPLDKMFAFITCFVVLEAGRRTIGWVFIVLSAAFIIYGLYGPYFPGMWAHKGFNVDTIFQYFYHTTNGIWGTMTGYAATMLAMFGIFGAVLSVTGGAETFIAMGRKMVGNTVGGAGKVALISSGIFGMFSGQPVANVMATGTFTIPMMKRAGYSNEWAGATVAVASTGGQIMPPIMGAGAFIMSQLTGITYYKIALAGIFPAILFYVGAYFAIHYESKKRNIIGCGENQPTLAVSIKQSIVLFIPLFTFMFFIVAKYSVTLSACYASIIGFVVYLICFIPFKSGAKQSLKETASAFHKVSISSGNAIISLTTLMVSAQAAIVFIQFTGFGVKLSNLIMEIGRQNLFLCLLLAMIVCIILGMGLPATAAYIIGAAVLVSPMVQLGIPMLAAHMFVFYFAALSNITPPVCAGVYVSSSLADSNWFKTGILSCMIALPIFIIPFAFVYCNGMLFIPGSTIAETVMAFATASIGSFAIAIAIAGYRKRLLNNWMRAVFIVTGAFMVTPFVVPSILAFVVFVVMIVLDELVSRRDSNDYVRMQN